MAIESVKLENFTVFENFECEFSPGVNVLIGENGTGKTHLLKVLHAFCNHSLSEIGVNVELYTLFKSNPMSSRAFNRNINKDIFIQIKINKQKYNYDTCIKKSMYGSLHDGYGSLHIILHDDPPITPISEKIFSTLIPAKDMLSISHIVRMYDLLSFYNELKIDTSLQETDYNLAADASLQDMDYNLAADDSLLNIIIKAQKSKLDTPPKFADKILPKLEKVMNGKVFLNENDNSFWIRKNDGREVIFAMEAEGHKKFGLLWQLIMNGQIAEGTVLFWDEPEANLNPKLLSVMVEVILELAKNGVQIFLATHEYNLMKYFSIKKKDDDNVSFISLYESGNGVLAETAEDYNLLENNAIIDANTKLLEEDYERVF
ncbi:MAG: AAA family ATPase [Firmicutes bacterium]|nr:AAA family ATPase [Bacillota bacterium]